MSMGYYNIITPRLSPFWAYIYLPHEIKNSLKGFRDGLSYSFTKKAKKQGYRSLQPQSHPMSNLGMGWD